MTSYCKLTLMILGILGPSAASADPTGSGRPAEELDSARVRADAEAIVGTFARIGAFQGVALLASGDDILFEQAFGMATLSPAVESQTSTRFHIASVSKPFTSTAILILEERGQLDVDAPLSKLLPDYPRGDELTMDHLLTHTSGIPNINGLAEYDAWSSESHTTAGLLEKFKDLELEFVPGERYAYSNSNYAVLAHIIEIVSGQSFGEFLESEIFRPIGMKDTEHHVPGYGIPGLATGHVPVGATGFEPAPNFNWSIKTGGGSLISTARDLFRFHRALQDGRLVSRETLESAYGFDRGIGQGWFPRSTSEDARVYISGRSPGYTAHFERFVEQDRCFILVSNLYVSPPRAMTEALSRILSGDEPNTTFEYESEIEDGYLAQFTGTYQFGDDWFVPNVRVEVEDLADHLRVVYLDTNSAGYEFLLIPMDGRAFFDRNHGGLVRFEPEETGRFAIVYEHGREWLAKPSD